ncbi:hypothetical protein ACFTWS_06235 [Streptomyces sp. NPDC057027]|uniref:hypothetical protein n=1 Tax=Streptomyces sp. NPDC057027 TaxID=3346004 RepID=UPI003630BA99
MSDTNSSGREFSVPPEGQGPQGTAGGASGVSFEPSPEMLTWQDEYTGVADPRLGEAKEAVAEAIQQYVYGRSPGARGADDLAGAEMVRGVAVGLGGPGSEGAPGQPVLQVYVAERMTADQVRALLSETMHVPLDRDVPLEVIHSGIIRAASGAFRTRPAPGGISVGHYLFTAGTIGCLAVGRSGPAANKVLCLSCNHVLAQKNNATLGDSIIQPGQADGGDPFTSADQIAVLENYGILDFSGKRNYVDCAVGWCFPDRVTRSLFHLVGGVVQYFSISSQTRSAAQNMWVGKMGSVSQLTYGMVTSTNWSGSIDYDNGDVAYFDRQISISNPGYAFGRRGDSGAIIWTADAATNPVGLLFAVDEAAGTTFANPIDWVLATLDINLST